MRIICCIYKDFVWQLKSFLPSFCHLYVPPGWGHLITLRDPSVGHFNGPGRGSLNNNFQKVKSRGGRGMLNLRFDRYITFKMLSWLCYILLVVNFCYCFIFDLVATRVLEHSHELHGSKLTICRFIPTVARQVKRSRRSDSLESLLSFRTVPNIWSPGIGYLTILLFLDREWAPSQ